MGLLNEGADHTASLVHSFKGLVSAPPPSELPEGFMSVKQASRTRRKKAGKCSCFDWKAGREDECNVIAGYTFQCSPLSSQGGTCSRHFLFTISTIEVRWAS